MLIMTWSFLKTSELGPKHWEKRYPKCKEDNQSPIDINSTNVKRCNLLCSFRTKYKNSKCDIFIKDNVHFISYDKGSYIEYKDAKYKLYQIAIHTPSLHTIDNIKYAMELNLYHKSTNGSIVIVSILVDENDRFSSSQDFFQQFTPHLKKNKTNMSISTEKDWSINQVLPIDKSIYIYKGSLPYPPCDENITWIVYKEPINITRKSLSQIKNIIQDGKNSRKTNKLKGRIVYFNSNNYNDNSSQGQVYVQCKKVNISSLDNPEDENIQEEMIFNKNDKKTEESPNIENEAYSKKVIRIILYIIVILLGILMGGGIFNSAQFERIIIKLYQFLFILPRS